jgi:hypothetical protein
MADPTYDQVIQALQAADAAGNVEDARQLAQMAAALTPKAGQQQPQQTQPQVKESDMPFGSFGRRVASLADTTIGGVIPAVAQTVAYPLARTVMGPEQAQAASQRVVGMVDQPVGKFVSSLTGTDITKSPEYQGEASRQLTDFIGANVQKGAQWLAEKTGQPQADIESYLSSVGLMAPAGIKAGVKAVTPLVKEAASNVVSGVQAPFETQLKERAQRLSSEDYARGPQIEAAKEAQRLGIALKPTDLQPSVGAKITTSMGGAEGLDRIASANKNNVRKIALNEMDLSPDTQLNGSEAFKLARDKVAKPYNDIRSLPTMTADEATLKSLNELRPDTALIGSDKYAKATNAVIDDAVKKVSAGLDGDQLLKNVQVMRQRARKTYNNKSASIEALDVADTNLALANTLEKMIESNVTDPKLLEKFRDARQKMARSYAYEGATDFNTGIIDVNRLAKITAKDSAMTGDIASLGKVAGNFPDAFTTKAVKQGTEAAHIGRTGLAGSLGGLLGYALGGDYASGVAGSLLGAGAGETVQSLAAKRMASPEYQRDLTIRDMRLRQQQQQQGLFSKP